MDVNATWSEILAILAQPMTSENADRLEELAYALDGWLARGGYAPGTWPVGTLGYYRHACAYGESVGMSDGECVTYAAWFVAEWATDIDTDTDHTREVVRFRRIMSVATVV